MRIKSGIEGFDVLVEGGFLQGRQYLVSGSPGSGKTTFGVQFLTAGGKPELTLHYPKILGLL